MIELGGILCALITHFTDDGSKIDETRLRDHVERMIAAGVHGLVPGGSTGEFTALTTDERKQLHELVIKYADGRVPVVASTGGLTTAENLDLVIHAAKVGTVALMVVPPFYDPQATRLPIMYYNIPAASGLKLSSEELAGLSQVGVQYIKDTSGDAPALTDLLFTLQDKVTTFNGWDTLTFYGLAAVAKGSVWGATNFIPELSVQLWDAVAVKGDLKTGCELWSKILPIVKYLDADNYSASVKTGVELRGYKTGGPRKPFKLLSEEGRDELARLLGKAGVKVAA
ncbi:hypothetical protein DV736_g5225, partial [Chaetothyriales sp. CBS 134916]